MTELMRRQSSAYEGYDDGCVGGFFHFFDFYQRLHVKKMLSYRRHGRDAGGTKLPKSMLSDSPIVKEHENLDTQTELLMEGTVNTTKSSGKGSMITLISKLYKKKDRKKKISPLASRLLRTISIHHLECNDYVIPEGIASDTETSMVDTDSSETDSPASNKQVIMWPRESIVNEHYPDVHSSNSEAFVTKAMNKANDSLWKWKSESAIELGADHAFLSRDLDLFEANSELYLRILEDHHKILEHNVLPQHCSSPEIVLTKSHSFPRRWSTKRRNGELSRLKRKGGDSCVNQKVQPQAENSPSLLLTSNDNPQDEATISCSSFHIEKPNAETLDSAVMFPSFELPSSPHKLNDQKDRGFVLNGFKVLRDRIKDVIRINDRISMDGFLHKIPYGHKAHEKHRLYDGPAPDKYNTESRGSKLGSDGSTLADSKYRRTSIQRSRSLTESLDKYSLLLESMSLREPRRPLQRLKSTQEHDRKSPTPKTWGRMLSNPEIRSYDFSQLFDELRSPKVLGDKNISSLVHTEESQEAYIPLNRNGEDTDQQMLIVEDVQNEPCNGSDDLSSDRSSDISLYEQHSRTEAGSLEKRRRPSPISVPNSSCQEKSISPMKYSITEDPVVFSYFSSSTNISPMKYLLTEGSDLKPGLTTFGELQSPATSISVEIVKANLDKVQMPMKVPNSDLLNIQVDQKDENEFTFVRDILKKYGIGGQDFLDAGYSAYVPLDPLIFGAKDGTHYELKVAEEELENMTIDHLLLVDLVNEILSDITKRSISHGTGLSCFSSHIRQKPIENHLPEVWEKTSWHLSFQRHPNRTFSDILARDFPKYDEWMNLRLDADSVGLELESMILDDLIDEVMLDF